MQLGITLLKKATPSRVTCEPHKLTSLRSFKAVRLTNDLSVIRQDRSPKEEILKSLRKASVTSSSTPLSEIDEPSKWSEPRFEQDPIPVNALSLSLQAGRP